MLVAALLNRMDNGPRWTRILGIVIVSAVILLLLASLRWPSEGWRLELEDVLSRGIGLPVEVESFSAGLLRPSIARNIQVKNVPPFEAMGSMVQVDLVSLHHGFLPRLLGRMNVDGVRAQGVTIGFGRGPSSKWNVETFHWATFKSNMGKSGEKLSFDLDDLQLSQVSVCLKSNSGETTPLFPNLQFALNGLGGRAQATALSLKSESPQSAFVLQGTVDHRNGYKLDLEERGQFDFGKYIESLSQDLPVEELGLEASGMARLEGVVKGKLQALEVYGNVDLSDVDISLGDKFDKSAGMRGEITYDVDIVDGVVLLKELRIRDMFSALSMSGEMDPAAAVKARLALASEGSNLKYLKYYIPSLKKTRLGGPLDATGDLWLDGEGFHYEGQMKGEDLRLSGFQVDEVVGVISSHRREMHLDRFSVNLYDGSMDAKGRISFEETNRGFELVFKLDGIDLGSISQDLSPEMRDSLDGTLEGEMNVKSHGLETRDLENVEGGGGLRVKEAKLAGLEPVRQVLRWTGEKDVHEMTFEKVEADFGLREGEFHTERMELLSDPISLQASGGMDFSSNLDYRLTIVLSTGIMSKLPTIEETESFHYDDDGRGVFKIGIKGTLTDPVIKIPSDLLMQMMALKKRGGYLLPPLPETSELDSDEIPDEIPTEK